jgi:hypothetical protein
VTVDDRFRREVTIRSVGVRRQITQCTIRSATLARSVREVTLYSLRLQRKKTALNLALTRDAVKLLVVVVAVVKLLTVVVVVVVKLLTVLVVVVVVVVVVAAAAALQMGVVVDVGVEPVHDGVAVCVVELVRVEGGGGRLGNLVVVRSSGCIQVSVCCGYTYTKHKKKW